MAHPRCLGPGWLDDDRRTPLSWSWEEPLLIKDYEDEECSLPESLVDSRGYSQKGTQGMPRELKWLEVTRRTPLCGPEVGHRDHRGGLKGGTPGNLRMTDGRTSGRT